MVDSGQVSRQLVGLDSDEDMSTPIVHNQTRNSGQQQAPPRQVVLHSGDSHHGLTCPTNCQPYNTLDNVDVHQLTVLPTVPSVYHSKWTPKDGNCMFHAVARGMGGHLTHTQVRLSTVNFMRRQPQDYVDFFPSSVDNSEHTHSSQLQALSKYLAVMARDSEYGENIILQGMCNLYKLGIVILKHTESGAWFWTTMGNMSSARKCFWLYLVGEHYENIFVATQVKF
ncbi:hypothetical protein A1Q1_03747 [Trichosporon asahii var. asahii CBS 2479]|uniref:OTU domain-containing protein n=1 Tax=Trichosporon asahii var. asahii (strain ATCC 90039 / CBS 2479 / JCM 2466 / KCTC 7840 / NBRC 103889/ NCYC 2677 / UAMH 7654) TaxID=1186058 RepID=J6EXF9_TRIAS|nr:hypothetical protein A1Q1_03747 [Trichosporon asahii var. asahii CBS 2479]EJT47492.1 hypothetical protein A1Q1_03747 [Trichosporon asahii var. asahii CBS 2479]